MAMNKSSTEELIDRLGDDLRPVRRLQAVRLRAALLIGTAALVVCAALLFIGGRNDLADMRDQTPFIIENMMMIIAAIAAAVAAFQLAVPDTRIRPLTWALLAIASTIWLALTGHALHGVVHQAARAPDYQNLDCVNDLTGLVSLPLLLAMVMLGRSAPLWLGWAGYAAVLAVSSVSALGMRFLCGNDDAQHLLSWHFIPVLGFSLLGMVMARHLPLQKKI